MIRKVLNAIVWLLKLCPPITVCGLLAACGQKGPLVLPEPTEAEIGQETAQSEEDQQEGEDDEAGGN